jgi:hypothetical protein
MVRAPCRLATSIISSIFAEFDPDHAIADKSTRNPPSWGWEVSFSSMIKCEQAVSALLTSPSTEIRVSGVSLTISYTPKLFLQVHFPEGNLRMMAPTRHRLNTMSSVWPELHPFEWADKFLPVVLRGGGDVPRLQLLDNATLYIRLDRTAEILAAIFGTILGAQLSPSIVSPIRQSTDVSAEPGDTPHEFWVAYYQRMRVPPPVARRLDTHLANTLNVIGHYLMAVAGRLRLPLNIGHLFLGGRSNNPLLLLIACDSLLIALVRLGNSLQMSLMGEHLLATQTAGNQRRIFTHDGLIIIEKTPNGEYPVLPLEHELRNFFELGFSVVDPSSTTPRIVIRGVGANVAGFLLAAREAGLCPTAAITHNLDAPDLSVVRDVVDVGVTIISHVAIPTFEAQISTYLTGRPTPEWRRSSSALKPLTRSVRRCFALLSLNLYSNCLPSPEETLATAAFLLILLDSPINSLFINDSFSAPPLLVAGLAI